MYNGNITPRQWLKYIYRLEKNNLAICDGVTENIDLFASYLMVFGLFTGLGIFFIILHKWDWIKKKIKGGN